MESSHFGQSEVMGHMPPNDLDMPQMNLKLKVVIGHRVRNTRHHHSNNSNNKECHLKLATSNLEFQQNMNSSNMQFQQNMSATIQDLKTQIGQLANTVSHLQLVGSNNLPSQTILNPRGECEHSYYKKW
ncbi:hypothetical protein CR513_27942, partial [Mucuna pruriens]